LKPLVFILLTQVYVFSLVEQFGIEPDTFRIRPLGGSNDLKMRAQPTFKLCLHQIHLRWLSKTNRSLVYLINLHRHKHLNNCYALTESRNSGNQYSEWLSKGRSSSPGGSRNFNFCMSSWPSLGPTQTPIQYVPGAFSPGLKRQGREADHSPPTSLEVKKKMAHTSTPHTSQ
jgi:hypothetical protein